MALSRLHYSDQYELLDCQPITETFAEATYRVQPEHQGSNRPIDRSTDLL